MTASAPAEELAAPGPSGRKRVLVVDDEPEVRELLIDYFQDKGFEALGVGSGEEAVDQVPTFRPHVVLLDIRMPGLSGVETLRRIKVLSQATPVVIISGIEDLETARQTLALGAADFVTKPFDFQYLGLVLEALLLG